jgi:hypothetical protein
MAAGGAKRGHRRRPVACQAVLMVQWLWSLSRLCVAVTSRHSDWTANPIHGASPKRSADSLRRRPRSVARESPLLERNGRPRVRAGWCTQTRHLRLILH